MLHRTVGECKEPEPRGRAFIRIRGSNILLYHPRNTPIRVGATERYHPRRQLRHAKTPACEAKVTLRPTRTAARDVKGSLRRAKIPLGRTAEDGSTTDKASPSGKPAIGRDGDARACAVIGRNIVKEIRREDHDLTLDEA